jgi:hypothetical protein
LDGPEGSAKEVNNIFPNSIYSEDLLGGDDVPGLIRQTLQPQGRPVGDLQATFEILDKVV